MIITSSIISLIFAMSQFLIIDRIPVQSITIEDQKTTKRLNEVYEAIYHGAESFLKAEYKICTSFTVVFTGIVFTLIFWGTEWDLARASFTAISFALGSFTSILSGYLGMKVAVYSNVRTTISAQKPGYTDCFNTAFRAGAVMGFSLCGLGMLVLYITLLCFRVYYPLPSDWVYLTECITGYGLGGSCIAMFGRVGGGIYTKAADVGADLVGKVVHGIPEDDPRNPATIADNVGDNVGDVAGMGSDLFGSFAEATCAALVLGSSIGNAGGWDAMMFPLIVSAVGLLVCIFCSFFATNIFTVRAEEQVSQALKMQLVSTTVLIIPAVYLAAVSFLPPFFDLDSSVGNKTISVQPYMAWLCVISGAVGGLIIGLITEYYTSYNFRPVREIANSCKTGAATNVM